MKKFGITLLIMITSMHQAFPQQITAEMVKNRTQASFSGMDLRDLDLSNTDLSGMDFSNATLNNINLSKANLSNANFTKAYLYNVNLSGANVSNANFNGARLSRVNLLFANLFNANLENTFLEFTKFTSTILTNVRLRGADFVESNFYKAKGLTFEDKCYIENADEVNYGPARYPRGATAYYIPWTWAETLKSCPSIERLKYLYGKQTRKEEVQKEDHFSPVVEDVD